MSDRNGLMALRTSAAYILAFVLLWALVFKPVGLGPHSKGFGHAVTACRTPPFQLAHRRMFPPEPIQSLAAAHQGTLQRLATIERQLTDQFHKVEAPVRALCLAALAGEPLLFIGPPGTGKSRLIRAFCDAAGLDTSTGRTDNSAGENERVDYFEYLLTPFTEPSELFGYYDIGRLQKGDLVRMNEERMMQNARVVYLDEVFNGSSAILNTILSFLNERVFHDRGTPRDVRMEFLFASTNLVPETPELRAIYDRFLIRCRLDNIAPTPGDVGGLLKSGWSDTYRSEDETQGLVSTDMLGALEAFRTDLRSVVSSGQFDPDPAAPFLQGLTHFVQTARQYDLSSVSNRRIVKMAHLLAVHRIWRHAINPENEPATLSGPDLALFPELMLDRADSEIQEKMAAWARTWQPPRAGAAPAQAQAPAPQAQTVEPEAHPPIPAVPSAPAIQTGRVIPPPIPEA